MTNNVQSHLDTFGSASSTKQALMLSTSIPTSNPPFSPLSSTGEPSIWRMVTQPATSPEVAAAKMASYQVPDDLVEPDFMAAGSPPIEGAISIAEQARALKNDPDLIYQFVHDNIDFYPNYGLHKGGWGALIDSNGNAFDQSDLMIQLLTVAGIAAQYVTGTVTLSAAQWSNWLNLATTDLALAVSLLSNGGFAVSSNVPANTITFNHCWVQATIGGVNYQFDPAIKTYTTIAGINLATTMGYNRANFLAHAQTGATITADYVEAIKAVGTVGAPGINDDLNTYSAALATYIKNTSPVPNLDQILGGRSIVPVVGPIRNTTLPYANAGFVLNTTLPAAFKATIQFNFDNSSGSFATSVTFNTADIYGLRQTFWYNTSTNVYTINVNGVVKATTAAQTVGVTKTLSFTIIHPYATTAFNQTTATSVVTGTSYAIGTGFGYASRQVSEIQRQSLAKVVGGVATAENVLGVSLSIIWYNFLGQYCAGADFINRLGSTYSAFHHNVGVIALVAAGSTTQILVNVFTNLFSTSALKTTSSLAVADQQMTLLWHQLEGTATTGISGVSSVTTPVVIAAYNNQSATTRTYTATNSNWYTTVRAALAAGGYSSTVLDGIELNSIALEQIQFGGTVSASGGDVLKLNISNTSLATNPTVLTYTTVTGDTPATVAAAFVSMVNSNPALNTSATGIKLLAQQSGSLIQIRQTVIATTGTTYTTTITGSVTMTLGRNTLTFPQSGNVTIGSTFVGYGYYIQDFFGLDFFGPLTGTLKGGLSAACTAAQLDNGALTNSSDVNANGRPLTATIVSDEPIDLFKGRYTYDNVDISVGNQDEPYQLSLIRSYTSGFALFSSGLGLGWNHNFAMSVQPSSDSFISFGFDNPVAAAAVIAQMYVCMDVLSSTQPTIPLANVVTLCISNVWMMNRMVNNTLLVQMGNNFETFAKLADGTYVAPLGTSAGTVVAFNAGTSTFSYTTPNKVVYNFNTANRIASIVYPFGITITFTYTGNNLTKVSNGFRSLTFAYDGSNNLASVTDGTRTVQYTVNTSNQLATFKDPLTNATTFSYSGTTGLLTKIFEPANPTSAVVTNTYDSLSRIQTQADAYNNLWTYYFAGSRSEEHDPNNFSRVWYFDGFGSPLKVTDQLGNTTISSFDGLKRAVLITLPESNSIAVTYDQLGNVLSTTSKPKPASSLANIVNSFTYDPAWNQVKTSKDGRGNITTFTYSPTTGRLTQVQYPAVAAGTPTVALTYNSIGQLLTSTDPTSIVTKYSYDPTTNNLLQSIMDSGTGRLNLTTNVTYDTVGNVQTIEDPNGNTTTLTFDSNRRLTQKMDPTPFNYLTKQTFDTNNNLLTVQNQTGNVSNPWQITTWTYSFDNKKLTMVDSSSDTTTWSYDTKRRLASVIDAMTRKTQWTYDARDNLYQTTDATNTICDTRLYTANGLLASVKDARSNLTQFNFDGFDRPNQTIYADTSYKQNVLYDANDNVLTARTRAGNQIVNTFDALNRLSTKAPASEPTVTFGYDLASRLLSATKPTVTGDPSSGAFSRLYDTAGRFYTESYPDGKQVIFGLDSNGNTTKLTYPDGYFVTRSYDQLNRLSNIFLNGATTAAAALTYDQLSRRTALTYNNGASSSYGYASPIVDDLTSIAHAFVGSSVTFGYTYNNDHEITVQSLTDNTYQWFPTAANVTYAAANAVNEYPTVGGTTYSYNGDGCLASDGVLTLGYDTEDHLTSASKTGTSVSYVYDGFHRQAQKSATIGGTTAKSRYIYSGWQRIADYDGTAGTLQNRYVYADGLDEPLMQVSSAGVVTYLHANAQGSVIGVTNTSGAVVSKNVYGLFGETSSLLDTNFGFTGQRFDPDTGLYFMKNRFYAATIGRFLQPDPLGFTGDLNLYNYADNNPALYSDPSGFSTVGALGRSIAGGIGAVLTGIGSGIGYLFGGPPAYAANPTRGPVMVLPSATIQRTVGGSSTLFTSATNLNKMTGSYILTPNAADLAANPSLTRDSLYVGKGSLKRMADSMDRTGLSNWVFKPATNRTNAFINEFEAQARLGYEGPLQNGFLNMRWSPGLKMLVAKYGAMALGVGRLLKMMSPLDLAGQLFKMQMNRKGDA